MCFDNEVEKLHYFSIFIWSGQNNVVYLHPQFHAGEVCKYVQPTPHWIVKETGRLLSDIYETYPIEENI